ncbi:hypothetical protein P7D22_22315 [Lichenihabitans sp. Uapishka_5]|uniref:hypothetical protein n=1 Tax=Lichenihabitans sp. Uapishka_5 TaxID=3037302 RepID=UPI0029E7E34C|nr:hypothetical protein [Lichenihabitans sp. Uapishka_5]MDX7953893.1 hypothetical protein [Lichenihabitans sp. Uapishka_5]
MAVSRHIRMGAVLGVVLVNLSVAGCGRRGKLEPAPDPNAPVRSDVTKQGVHRRAKNPPILPPHDSFILDPLL